MRKPPQLRFHRVIFARIRLPCSVITRLDPVSKKDVVTGLEVHGRGWRLGADTPARGKKFEEAGKPIVYFRSFPPQFRKTRSPLLSAALWASLSCAIDVIELVDIAFGMRVPWPSRARWQKLGVSGKKTLHFPPNFEKAKSPLLSAASWASLSCAAEYIIAKIAFGMRVHWPSRARPRRPVAKARSERESLHFPPNFE